MTAPAAALPAGLPYDRPAPPVLVDIQHLSKRFPVRRRLRDALRHPLSARYADALSDVTCEIRQGEFFGLLGPNGAGKSTLFRVLSTFVLPDTGTAIIDGLDLVRDAREVRTRVGLVSADERSLNWRLSARENLRFYAALYGVPQRAQRDRIEEVLSAVELADVGEKLAGSFSSGMKQRLLIARTLLPAPKILLLDEPTRSLDPIAARRFRQFLKFELSLAQGCTVLLATHNADEALELCGRVGVLHLGQLLAVDSPRALSRYLGIERFQAWTRTPTHAAFATLTREGLITDVAQSETDGWDVVEFSMRGGIDRSAEVLGRLTRQGAEIGRFQKVQPALADVLEQVVARHTSRIA